MGMLDKIKGFIPADDVDDEEYEEEETAAPAPAAVPSRQAVKPLGRTAVPQSQARPYTMVVVEPKDYKDAEKIADHIKGGRPILMNIEQTEEAPAERIVDFVQGVMYALDGRMDRVSDTIYLCAPNSMTVTRESFAAYTSPSAGIPAMEGEMPQWDFKKG